MSDKKFTDEDCHALIHLLRIDARISKLTDAELSKAAMNSVYGKMIIGSEEECVFLELLSRFERFAGIDELDNEADAIAEAKGVRHE